MSVYVVFQTHRIAKINKYVPCLVCVVDPHASRIKFSQVGGERR